MTELSERAALREYVLHLLSVQRLKDRAAIRARARGRWAVIR